MEYCNSSLKKKWLGYKGPLLALATSGVVFCYKSVQHPIIYTHNVTGTAVASFSFDQSLKGKIYSFPPLCNFQW